MKRLIVIVLAAVMLLSLSACGTTERARETIKGGTSRMVYVEETNSYCIVYDKYTKVMYAVSSGGYNCGNFTLLVTADGKPLLYEQ